MRKYGTIGLGFTALLLVTALAGCGGGGGGGSSPSSGGGGLPPPPGFVGSYTGSIQSTQDTGTGAFTIDAASVIAGSVKFSKLANSVPIAGTLSTDGANTLIAHYFAGGYNYTVSGPFVQDPTNLHHYTATLAVHNDTTGGASPNATLSVIRS